MHIGTASLKVFPNLRVKFVFTFSDMVPEFSPLLQEHGLLQTYCIFL